MRRRIPKREFVAFARAMAERYKPGANIGRRLGGEPVSEEQHFYLCKQCGQAVDKRDLGAVFYYEVPGHKPLPEN